MYRHHCLIAVFSLVSISLLVDSITGSFDQFHSSWQQYEETKVSQTQLKGCDLFKGSWVYDDSIRIYNSTVCPFIGQGFDCQRNGRPDHEYLKYRWKPEGCNIPSFDGRDFMERHKGKKIMFVGDSLSNNMWQSFTCMLHSSVPEAKYSLTHPEDDLSTFSFPDYGISIMLVKNTFLVDLVHQKEGTVLKLDSVTTGDRWKGMDYLVFNTYHWWFHTGALKTWDFFQVGDKLYKDMDRLEALKIGLTTWSKWIDSNMDPRSTSVFFQGISATHLHAKEWNDTSSTGCEGQTQPVLGPTYPSPEIPGKAIVEGVLSAMMNPPHYLDITLLSQLRKDGHPSIYTGKGSGFRDCSHWCLAGVPDTWNQLLYASLLRMEGVDPGIAPSPNGPQPSISPPPALPSPSPLGSPILPPPAVPSPSVSGSPISPPRAVPSHSPSSSPSPSPSAVPPGPSGSPGPSRSPSAPSPSDVSKHPGQPSPGQPTAPGPPELSPSGLPGPSDSPTASQESEGWMLRSLGLPFDLVMLLLVSVLLLIQQ